MIEEGKVLNTQCGATVTVGKVINYSAQLTIDGWYFDVGGLKELRKFLKKLQKQLEAARV